MANPISERLWFFEMVHFTHISVIFLVFCNSDVIQNWLVISRTSGGFFALTNPRSVRVSAGVGHIFASHIWPTVYRLDGPSCDAATPMQKGRGIQGFGPLETLETSKESRSVG